MFDHSFHISLVVLWPAAKAGSVFVRRIYNAVKLHIFDTCILNLFSITDYILRIS